MADSGCSTTSMSVRVSMLMVVVVCCVIQTKCDVFASNSTYVVEGVGFGEIKKFVDIDRGVYHMEFDIADPNQLIFSDQHVLKSSDGTSTRRLIGNTTSGYLEAEGVLAQFRWMTGFTQLNRTSIIVVDRGNHCLRHIDRAVWQTSPFVGQCTKSGSKDGQAASFYYPYSVIRDQRFYDKLLVTEENGKRVRQVDFLTRETKTLFGRNSGLVDPHGVAFDLHRANLVISNRYNVVKCDIKRKSCSRLAGGGGSGKQDGRLQDARFDDLRELVPVTDNLFLVVDRDNKRLRIINTAAGSVSSVCKGLSGSQYKPAERCSLNGPHSLLVKDDLIYIGGYKSIQTIPFGLQHLNPLQSVCPDDIFVSLDDGQSFANLNITAPSGVLIRVNLPIGEHTYTYNPYQKAECNFTISVIGYSRIRTRLDFSAEYDIKCSEIESIMVLSLLMSSAEQLSKHINVLCSGECKVVGGVMESCSNDTVTLRWSTDLTLPTGMSKLPEQVKNKILPKLNQHHGLLNVVVSTREPPLVYPKISEDGRAINLVLTEFCVDGFMYDAVTTTCV